jgi:hypothetical protein
LGIDVAILSSFTNEPKSRDEISSSVPIEESKEESDEILAENYSVPKAEDAPPDSPKLEESEELEDEEEEEEGEEESEEEEDEEEEYEEEESEEDD